MDLSSIRKEYAEYALSEEEIVADPFKQLELWLEQASRAACNEYTAMSLATVGPDGTPSLRMVLLKYLIDGGLCFFTNYESRKGDEIKNNPRVAALLFWSELERQVRIEGVVEKLPAERSDEYYSQRPAESRISARISPQSQVVNDRSELEHLWLAEIKKWEGNSIERPENWGGYKIIPHRFEFWQGRPSRLHDRIEYKREAKGWTISRLAP